MKFNSLNRFISILLAAALTVCLLAGIGVANGSIYVNGSANTLSQSLAETYAIGGNGSVEKLGTDSVYAMTGTGLQQITDGQSGFDPSDVTVTEAPLGGTIPIKNSTVKIGLQYKTASYNTSVDYATLTNYAGSGFRFGYYDGSRTFHELGSTAEKSITMLRDTNVTIGSNTIGCYHIRLSGTYASFSEAQNAASQYSDGFPAYYSGSFYVLLGGYQSKTEAEAALSSRGVSGEAYSASSRCVVVAAAGQDRILFEYDCGTSSNLGIEPVSTGGAAVTSLSTTGFRYYGGFEFLRYSGEGLTVISVVNVEDYVKGVIPYEMSSSWPIETLKAGAIAARNYVQYNYGKYAAYGFDIVNDAKDQVYRGLNAASATTDRACDETRNQYMTYNGTLCCAYYFSSDGGATESTENVWVAALGYCRGKIDPFEAALSSGVMRWSKDFTAVAMGEKLGLGKVTNVECTYSPSGNMIGVGITDESGKTLSFTKSGCITLLSKLGFSYTSMHYTITHNEEEDTYRVSGAGWGHNIGMSQWGAYSMAKNYGYNYREILGFYYTGVAISQGA